MLFVFHGQSNTSNLNGWLDLVHVWNDTEFDEITCVNVILFKFQSVYFPKSWWCVKLTVKPNMHLTDSHL
jgi:hypothetical protein